MHNLQRRKTREVLVGNIGVGADNPVRIQSMTTSDTRDVGATVDQVKRLSDAGCEIARVTVQGKKEAEACEQIKNQLIQQGYTIPLVADIHFYPPAAMMVVDFVEKVRINPGNYLDKRASFKLLEYTDTSYQEELDRIEEKFTPLVTKCKHLKRAMRIGTNHGSLSDRIMNRFGDTPAGMVESALEYARICRKSDFHAIIFSMKSSNTHVMIQAYRLLVTEMTKLGWDYPLHLGVTEAGEGEDGRVKSAIGIGALLLEGLGDTIRVSLTEDPWFEIDPCQRLVSFAANYEGKCALPNSSTYQRREVKSTDPIPLHRDGSVGLAVDPRDPSLFKSLGCPNKSKEISTVDVVRLTMPDGAIEKELEKIGIAVIHPESSSKHSFQVNLGEAITTRITSKIEWEQLKRLKPHLILLSPPPSGRLSFCREFFKWLREEKLDIPLLLNFSYTGDWESVVISASAECGALLCDGIGEGLFLEGPYPPNALRNLCFNILQGSRMRTIKTEFISCPSCGRTLFNLQQVSERIRQRTEHLPGVKIAIMGCIVNGPGEMADADFGYVGSRTDKVDLYVGKTCVEKNIDHADADERLVDLIKSHGRWEEPR